MHEHRPASKSELVVAEFRDRESLDRAVRELMGHGVPADSIRVAVGAGGGQSRLIEIEEGAGTLRGALIGAGLGAVAGVVLLILVLSGALGSPGVSILQPRGIAGALRTVLLTAAAAVPLGAILGMGRWRSDATITDEDLARAGARVTVSSEELSDRAWEILRTSGAVSLSAR